MCRLLLALILSVGAVQLSAAIPSVIDRTQNDLKLEDWFVTRVEWDADLPIYRNMTPTSGPQQRVIIAHSGGEHCVDSSACKRRVKGLQRYHMDGMGYGYPDISYNFLVGGDGRVYEGRGWDYERSYSDKCTSGCLGVAFIGDYRRDYLNCQPKVEQLESLTRLLDLGLSNSMLIEDFKVTPQCQAQATLSPGDSLYYEMITWERYSPTDGDFGYTCSDLPSPPSSSSVIFPPFLPSLLLYIFLYKSFYWWLSFFKMVVLLYPAN